jgi:hypothetical protein
MHLAMERGSLTPKGSRILSELLKEKYEELYLLLFYGIFNFARSPLKGQFIMSASDAAIVHIIH